MLFYVFNHPWKGGDTYEFRQMENRGRKDGTYQFCNYGDMLEKYFPDIVYLPDVEVNSFLSILSKMPEVQKVLQEISDTNHSF